MLLDAMLARADDNLPEATERLLEFLRIPSISTNPEYKGECERAADWLVRELVALGFEASKRITSGHPMVVAHSGGDGPHITFYGHYDVQPVDPLSLWSHDPFDAHVQDTPTGQVIRARGACDDKGQLMTFIEACRVWKDINGTLPHNLTLFFEGEEESGSPSLVPFMTENAKELAGDIALVCDTGLFQSSVPAIVTMLRGMVCEELTITGPDRDMHSGMAGGLAINPIRVLTRILGSLHDEAGRVTLPGFYDDVPELPEDIQRQWQDLGYDHSRYLGEVGLSVPAGEQDRTPLEMIWSRPTCDVNGIWGGYTDDGFKTVLPSKAHAKISFRIVGQQDPQAIRESFRSYVRSMLPADCKVEFQDHGSTVASVMEITDPAFEKARQALSDEWGLEAAYIGCGGSIPIAGYFKSILGMDAMLVGFGRSDDKIHSPNEKYQMESFHKGIRSWLRILTTLV